MAVGANGSVTDSVKTPIADGFVVSREINALLQTHYVSVSFYSDADCKNLVSKGLMSGTVTFDATVNGREYGVMQVGEDILGVLTLGGNNELIGQMSGSYSNARVTFNITNASGATHALLKVASFTV